jgi:predicted acylesterase/phospholipase RssA
MVGLESARLRFVTGTAAVIESNGDPVLDLDPTVCSNERAAVEELEQQIRDLQEELRTGTAVDKASVGRQIRALRGPLRQARADLAACISVAAQAPPQPAVADLRRAVLASASIPGFFPPVGIAGETYVDGGIREELPAREALRIGTDVIFAISASLDFSQGIGASGL